MSNRHATPSATAPPWVFRNCRGYAFLGLIDDESAYLSKCGLQNLTRHAVTRPRALRFWFVDYPNASPENDPGVVVSYQELSMAFLVDVRDVALSCTETAWHLPKLYVTDSIPLQVGRDEYGFPKELATVDISVTGNDGRFEVRGLDGSLVWGIEASQLDFLPVEAKTSLGPLDASRRDILDFQPRCFQDLKGRWVSPRLEVSGKMHISIATAAQTKYLPTDRIDPIGLGFSSTGFVLKTEFDMKLYLEKSVCD